ncbi:MAG: SIS domain-containing protein [Chloroflexi bacterium]|nr:SIS domain-containing protein [Chloroflexota bacterium]
MESQTPTTILEVASYVLKREAEAVDNLRERLGPDFERAAEMLLNCAGRVIVTGVGKSGHLGRKLAATLASTGTPALFVHAGEAAHGDLGMMKANDVVIAMSHSGATDEVIHILPIIRDIGAHLIAMTSKPDSPLGKASDVVLNLGVGQEADPRGLAPTSSAVAMLALGDALAMAVSVARGFTRDDFLRFHPGGSLGRLRQKL